MMNAMHQLPQSLLQPTWLVVGRRHVQEHEQKKEECVYVYGKNSQIERYVAQWWRLLPTSLSWDLDKMPAINFNL